MLSKSKESQNFSYMQKPCHWDNVGYAEEDEGKIAAGYPKSIWHKTTLAKNDRS